MWNHSNSRYPGQRGSNQWSEDRGSNSNNGNPNTLNRSARRRQQIEHMQAQAAELQQRLDEAEARAAQSAEKVARLHRVIGQQRAEQPRPMQSRLGPRPVRDIFKPASDLEEEFRRTGRRNGWEIRNR